MNKRLEMLEQMTARGQADTFAWYGLAMEYRRLERIDDALATFTKLREKDPDYLPQYLMAGQVLIGAGRMDEARDWLQHGLELAATKGNDKAESELRQALDEITE